MITTLTWVLGGLAFFMLFVLLLFILAKAFSPDIGVPLNLPSYINKAPHRNPRKYNVRQPRAGLR